MNDRITCPHCGQNFNPSGYAQHLQSCNKAAAMLTRHFEKLMRAKKRKALIMPDMTKDGVFPPTTESVEERMNAIKAMAQHNSELREQGIRSVVNTVRAALKWGRLNGRRAKWWQKHYDKLGVAVN